MNIDFMRSVDRRDAEEVESGQEDSEDGHWFMDLMDRRDAVREVENTENRSWFIFNVLIKRRDAEVAEFMLGME